MTEDMKVEWRPKGTYTWTDISDYDIGRNSLKLSRIKKNIEGGSLRLDEDEVPVNILANDEVRLSVVDESAVETHIFTGILIPDTDDNDENIWSFENFARLARIRKAYNVFLQQDDIAVIKLLIDEYLPEIWYDSDSIPDLSSSVLRDHRFAGDFNGDIFDAYAERNNRIWYVDKDLKFHLVEVSFTDNGYTVNQAEIIGNATKASDISKWQTVVTVEGQVTEILQQEDFTVAAGTDEYELADAAKSVEVKLIPAGSGEGDVFPLNGSSAGRDLTDAEAADANIDYFFTSNSKTIRLLPHVERAVGDTVRARYTSTNTIKATEVNALAFEKYKVVEGPPIRNRLIDTEAQAVSIAQIAADARGEPITVRRFETVWNTNVIPGNKIGYQDQKMIDLGEAEEKMNVLELRIDWGEAGMSFNVLLNNFDFGFEDAIDELNQRLRDLEERDLDSDTTVNKTLIFVGNFAIEVYRVDYHQYTTGNSFRLDYVDGSGMLDNASRYLDGNNGAGLVDGGKAAVWNVNNKVKLFFNDSDEIQSSSTATMDATNRKVTFTGAQVLDSEVLHYSPGDTVTKVRLNTDGRPKTQPTAHYPLDNDTRDISGQRFHGVANSTTLSYTTGKVGTAGVFDQANDDYIQIPNASDLIKQNTAWSVALWYYADSIDAGDLNDRMISFPHDDPADTALMLGVGSSNNPVWGYRDALDSFTTRVLTGETIGVGAWHHFVVTYDGTNYRAYHDGTLIETVPDTFITFGDLPTYIGGKDATTNNFDGRIDQVMLFDGTILTQAEIDYIYNSASGRSLPVGSVLDVANPVTFQIRSGDGAVWNAWETLTLGTTLTMANTEEQLQVRLSASNHVFYSRDVRGVDIGIEIEIIEVT